MADQSLDRESRRSQLAAAKEKLEQRRKARQALKAAREQRSQGKQNLGKQYVENFLKIIQEQEKSAIKRKTSLISQNASASVTTESKLSTSQGSKARSKYRAPGRRVGLDESNHDTYFIKLRDERKVDSYDKEIGTDPMTFDEYLIKTVEDPFDEKTMEENGDEIHAEFMRSIEVRAWPPFVPEKSKSVSVGVGQSIESKNDDEIPEWQRLASPSPFKEEIFLLEYKDADRLIKSGEFLDNFKMKTKWMERALGINEELAMTSSNQLINFEDLSFDMSDVFETMPQLRTQLSENSRLSRQASIIKTDIKIQSKELLTLRKQFIHQTFEGRPIGWIDISHTNNDWFLATYSRRSEESYSTEAAGCINIWNFVLPNNPEYSLYADTMVTSAAFHPTKNHIIYGATMTGQILQWDLRSNSYMKPVSRTNFIHGHSSPVFGLNFLPSMNSKSHHFVSVSNDGKVCMWRDNDLSDAVSEIILRIDEKHTKQDQLHTSHGLGDSHSHTSTISHSSTRPIELGTTCFSYSAKDWNTIILGSDEGSIYRAEIHGGGNADDEKDGSNRNDKNKITKPKKKDIIENQYVNVLETIDKAHEGPITNICYNSCDIQYATRNISGQGGSNNLQKQHKYSDNINSLYLTSSYDWSVKLWHNKYHMNGPISIFDNMTDYIYDVKWSKTKPGVFICGDGNAKLNIFDLGKEFSGPVYSTTIPKGRMIKGNNIDNLGANLKKLKAVTRIEFTRNGKNILVGDSDGMLHLYALHRDLYASNVDDWSSLSNQIERNISTLTEDNN